MLIYIYICLFIDNPVFANHVVSKYFTRATLHQDICYFCFLRSARGFEAVAGAGFNYAICPPVYKGAEL